MDIRTKLAIILVTVSLASMAALGWFAYATAASMLQDIAERQLNALAESKATDVEHVIESWRDRARLVASRTQLRINLDQYNRNSDPSLLPAMTRIIRDARAATRSVAAIVLYDINLNRLVDTGRTELVRTPPTLPDDITISDVVHDQDQSYITFTAPLSLEQRPIGSLQIVLASDDLISLTNDYTGLGELGETLIVRRTGETVAVLHPLRHVDTRGELEQSAISPAIEAAVAGQQRIFTEGEQDYRGAKIWAATRFIEETQWGLVVQMDEREELERVNAWRDSMLNLGLSLAAFAVFGGTLLGIYLARPLRQLAETVDRVRHGETDLRADDTREDEIGLLARALNEFLDQGPPARRDP
jgi:HAMP domain-containing protein